MKITKQLIVFLGLTFMGGALAKSDALKTLQEIKDDMASRMDYINQLGTIKTALMNNSIKELKTAMEDLDWLIDQKMITEQLRDATNAFNSLSSAEQNSTEANNLMGAINDMITSAKNKHKTPIVNSAKKALEIAKTNPIDTPFYFRNARLLLLVPKNESDMSEYKALGIKIQNMRENLNSLDDKKINEGLDAFYALMQNQRTIELLKASVDSNIDPEIAEIAQTVMQEFKKIQDDLILLKQREKSKTAAMAESYAQFLSYPESSSAPTSIEAFQKFLETTAEASTEKQAVLYQEKSLRPNLLSLNQLRLKWHPDKMNSALVGTLKEKLELTEADAIALSRWISAQVMKIKK